jgi:hypothetical protein
MSEHSQQIDKIDEVDFVCRVILESLRQKRSQFRHYRWRFLTGRKISFKRNDLTRRHGNALDIAQAVPLRKL